MATMTVAVYRTHECSGANDPLPFLLFVVVDMVIAHPGSSMTTTTANGLATSAAEHSWSGTEIPRRFVVVWVLGKVVGLGQYAKYIYSNKNNRKSKGTKSTMHKVGKSFKQQKPQKNKKNKTKKTTRIQAPTAVLSCSALKIKKT
jgi:beta-lactamase regulating signal transducer with metallopeptidase domain